MLLKAFHGDVNLVDDRKVVTLENLDLNKGQLKLRWNELAFWKCILVSHWKKTWIVHSGNTKRKFGNLTASRHGNAWPRENETVPRSLALSFVTMKRRTYCLGLLLCCQPQHWMTLTPLFLASILPECFPAPAFTTKQAMVCLMYELLEQLCRVDHRPQLINYLDFCFLFWNIWSFSLILLSFLFHWPNPAFAPGCPWLLHKPLVQHRYTDISHRALYCHLGDMETVNGHPPMHGHACMVCE